MRGDTALAPAPLRHFVSIHAPRVRGDLQVLPSCLLDCVSIHAPRVRGDRSSGSAARHSSFNSRPSCEGRRRIGADRANVFGFNSRPSCEGRPIFASLTVTARVSIHAPRVRGDSRRERGARCAAVSIHAPRVRGDRRVPRGRELKRVSIHAPRVRGDLVDYATRGGSRFNSRPSCEGRPPQCEFTDGLHVSIHAPRVRGDLPEDKIAAIEAAFQFTPLV